MLDEKRETKRLRRTLDILGCFSDDVVRRCNAKCLAGLLHLDSSGFVAFRARSREGDAVFFHLLNHFDAGNVLVRGAIAEIEEEIEFIGLDQALDLGDRVHLADERLDVPLGVRIERTGITRPIILGKGIGIEILSGEQADAKTDDMTPVFDRLNVMKCINRTLEDESQSDGPEMTSGHHAERRQKWNRGKYPIITNVERVSNIEVTNYFV